MQVHADGGGAEEGRGVPVDDAQGGRVPRWRHREEVAVHALDELVREQMLRRRGHRLRPVLGGGVRSLGEAERAVELLEARAVRPRAGEEQADEAGLHLADTLSGHDEARVLVRMRGGSV